MARRYPGGFITATFKPLDPHGDNNFLWLWGSGTDGRIGDNTIINRSSPVQIGSVTTWSKIAGGSGQSAAIKTDGTMWFWGKNDNGQLGQNDLTYRSSPIQVGALTTWSQVAGGQLHSGAIKTDGTMWLWGRGSYGQLGDDAVIARSSPIQVGALTTWSLINSGNSGSTGAIKTDGTMWLWGINTYGQAGDNTAIRRSSPVQIGANLYPLRVGFLFSFSHPMDPSR